MAHEIEDGGVDLQRDLRSLRRVGIAGLLPPGANKFLTYGTSVRFFESLGLPAAGVLVPVVGALESVVVSAATKELSYRSSMRTYRSLPDPDVPSTLTS